MGGNQSAFSFRIKKSGGVAVFEYYNVSGLNTIARVEPTSTTVRFYWNNNDNNYISKKTNGFEMLDGLRDKEFERIRSNYYTNITKVNNEYVEFTLFPVQGSGISFVSWLTMLSIVQPGFELKCTCTAGIGELSKLSVDNNFRYLTMISPYGISNNGVYFNQEGSTVYFENDQVDVNVITEEYDNLSNSNGDYILGVIIATDGTVTLDSTYMPYTNGTERIDDRTLLIKTTISPDTLEGALMANVNSNGKFIINNGIIVNKTSDGILCQNINNGMNFTILAVVT